MRTRALWAVLLVLLPLASAGQDKSKKTYELIYQDVQALKEQLQDLRGRLDRNAEDIRAIRDQLKALADLVRQSMAEQAGLQEGLRTVSPQYQDIVRRIDQLSLEIQKVSADLIALKPPEVPATAEEEAARGRADKEPAKEAAAKKKPDPKQPGEKPASPPPTPPAPTMSPQEAYAMAYNDYLKGNYDLAIESFKLYRQQFPASPLADNSLYWIGECYFSQRKFEEAVGVFDELVLAYPQGDKVAAATLKKGISYVELGRKDEALAVFKLVVAKYPLEEEARIAQAKIKELTEK